jgi:hypothetical protein
MMAIQKKTQSYTERILGDEFNPLVIETYGCFHFYFDSFFITCAQTTIVCQSMIFFNPFNVIFYYQQCVSIALQHAQAIMIF